jgi:hypothetical protein
MVLKQTQHVANQQCEWPLQALGYSTHRLVNSLVFVWKVKTLDKTLTLVFEIFL